jgi:hypothetical protein
MLAFVCASIFSPAFAETTGGIRGTVTDQNGSVLEGVSIMISSTSQTVSGRGTLSDRTGVFQVTSLPPAGDYVVSVSCPGFASTILSAIEVWSGRTSMVRIMLAPATQLRERVEVRAHPQMIDVDNPTTETRFGSEFIEALPLLGRNYQDVLALAPGVTDVDGDGNPNIHGARDTSVVTLVDGVSTTDPLTGKLGAQLNIESIQEIEIKTSGATAEFSRAQGGFANIITKSGGNQFGGAFKFFWRGSLLDGDGAGIDDARLHAGIGELELRGLVFNDFLPFLSFEGPIVRDRAWFFMAHEYVQTEEPVNALNLAFVRGVREFRDFVKLTWQIAANHRAALSFNYDPQKYLNQGLNSFTAPESGYELKAGGTVITMKVTSILSPLVALETSVSNFVGRPGLVPNLDRDTNGNGALYYDRNRNGYPEASERDPGDDFDRDGFFDVFEDANHNGKLDPGEDLDHDGRLTPSFGCEGALREDLDCDGNLDRQNEDADGNGLFDFVHEDLDGDRRLDLGVEDRNGNHRLDDAPVPSDVYPYGHLVPILPDRDFTIGELTGIITGPYFEDYSDRRKRFTFRQDLGVFVPQAGGSHDLKFGLSAERERFSRTTRVGDIMSLLEPNDCANTLQEVVENARNGVESNFFCTLQSDLPTVKAILHTEPRVDNEATNLTTGLYIQDSFKPHPNLSLGLGLRLDREQTDSFGYSYFDPVAQSAPFNRVNALAGGEFGLDDFLLGDNNGVQSFGILGDPLISGNRQAAAYLTDPMRVGALSRLTRHHSDISFGSSQTNLFIGDLFSGGELDTTKLQSVGIRPQRAERFRLTNNNLSPRLSVSWDPAANGRTKLFATWGRYFDKLFLSTIVAEKGPDQLNRYYLFDETGVRKSLGVLGVAVTGTPNHYIGTLISKSPPSTTQIDRQLGTPFSDEFTIGLERELAPDVAVAVTYVNRRYRDQLQDVDVNHSLRFGPDGKPLDVIGELVFAGGGNELQANRLPDGRPDLYSNNVFFNQILRIGNLNEGFYHGLELRLSKRQARRWELQGSYTYSRALGDAEDFQSRLGKDPSTVESEFGYLDFDQRHVVKVNASTFLPKDWQVGFVGNWASGLPFSIVSRFFALDNIDMQQFRTRYGFTTVEPGSGARFHSLRRNSERNDATLNIDLGVRKHLALGKATAAISLDILNLLNSDDLRIFTFEPNRGDFKAGDGVLLASPLQLDAERRFGRRFQVGFQLRY